MNESVRYKTYHQMPGGQAEYDRREDQHNEQYLKTNIFLVHLPGRSALLKSPGRRSVPGLSELEGSRGRRGAGTGEATCGYQADRLALSLELRLSASPRRRIVEYSLLASVIPPICRSTFVPSLKNL